jgi:hypothetical protein
MQTVHASATHLPFRYRLLSLVCRLLSHIYWNEREAPISRLIRGTSHFKVLIIFHHVTVSIPTEEL